MTLHTTDCALAAQDAYKAPDSRRLKSSTVPCTKLSAAGITQIRYQRACKHADLSALDSHLQAAYQGARPAATPASQATLLTGQRQWVRYVRDVCLDKACVERVYKARIELLQQNDKYIADRAEFTIPEGKSCRSVFFSRPGGTA